MKALGILLAVAATMFVFALVLYPTSFGFDGQLGQGCDATNSLCSYEEWRPNCLSEIDLLDGVEPNDKTCRFIYATKSGR